MCIAMYIVCASLFRLAYTSVCVLLQVRELEQKLDLERSAVRRLENQVQRLRGQLERLHKQEGDDSSQKSSEALRRMQKQLREVRLELQEAERKEQDMARKKRAAVSRHTAKKCSLKVSFLMKPSPPRVKALGPRLGLGLGLPRGTGFVRKMV